MIESIYVASNSLFNSLQLTYSLANGLLIAKPRDSCSYSEWIGLGEVRLLTYWFIDRINARITVVEICCSESLTCQIWKKTFQSGILKIDQINVTGNPSQRRQGFKKLLPQKNYTDQQLHLIDFVKEL